jgi:hypothetical protein
MTEGLVFKPQLGQEFSLLHVVQAGSGTRSASYIRGTGRVVSTAVKQQGREADHSPPTSGEVKIMWIYTSTPPYSFMA